MGKNTNLRGSFNNHHEMRVQDMNTPTVEQELAWCQVELANIKAGLFSMYTQDYIEGAISALRLAKEGASK